MLKNRDLRSWAAFLGLVGPAFLVCWGCAQKPVTYAADSNLRLTDQEQTEKIVLPRHDQGRVMASMASVAGFHKPVAPPRPAPHAMRWSDVEIAMKYATADVEMAVTRTIREDGYLAFHLWAVDDRPGRITVQKMADDRIYTAQAVVGRFEDDEAQAQRLLEAFARQMRLFGSKRAFVDDSD